MTDRTPNLNLPLMAGNSDQADVVFDEAMEILDEVVNTGTSSDTSSDTGPGLPVGGTTGQVLTKLSSSDGDADWQDPTGGGGGGGGGTYIVGPISVDSPPGTANAMDDEFEATSLNGKWSWGNQGSATATFEKGSVILTAPISGTDTLHSIEQPLPSGSSWKFRCKLSALLSGDYNSGGLLLRESATGKIVRFSLYHNGSSNIAWQIYTFSSYSAAVASLGTDNFTLVDQLWSAAIDNKNIDWLYLDLELSGGNYIWKVSTTGVEAHSMVLYSGSVTAYFTTAADHIGLYTQSQNATYASIMAVDFFRRMDGAVAPVARALPGVETDFPSTVDDLVMWAKADTITRPAGTPIPVMKNYAVGYEQLSFCTSIATQTGGPKVSASQLNGLNTLDFTTSAYDVLSAPGGTLLKKVSAFAVIKPTANPNGAIMAGGGSCFNWSSTSSSGDCPYIGVNGTSVIAIDTATPMTSGSWYLLDVTFDDSTGAYQFGAGGADTNGGTSSHTISGPNYCIGGANNSGTEAFTGSIAEIVVVNRVVTSTEKTNMRAYLASKWGL